ncbi:MAG: prepilin-type N-terminal cleavage/methylation domain-containing protein [Verrucomicrobiota bacterium]
MTTKPQNKRYKSHKGLTLVELLVVLVVLVATGGLLVPTINNALSRSHVATCATSFPEVHQMMQRVQIEAGQFGTDFDSGLDTADTTTPVNSVPFAGATLQAVALTAAEADALAAVGITTVVDHDATAADYNVTFNIGSTQRTLGDGEEVITLTDAQADGVFLPSAGAEKYIWLGIGRDWSLLSTLAPEPPVHFGDTPGSLPDEVHSRFGIIMQVADEAGDALEAAEFKRISYCIDGDGFETGDNHIEVYWQEIAQN